jgi:outer membrane biosynthesis protein TonB
MTKQSLILSFLFHGIIFFIIFIYLNLSAKNNTVTIQNNHQFETVIIKASLLNSKPNKHNNDNKKTIQKEKKEEMPKHTKKIKPLDLIELKNLTQQAKESFFMLKKTNKKQTIKTKKEINNKPKKAQKAQILLNQKTNQLLKDKKLNEFLKTIHQKLQFALNQINPNLYNHYSGFVLLGFKINQNHKIIDIHIIKSKGNALLKTIAQALLKKINLSDTKIPLDAEFNEINLPVKFEQGV